MTHARHAYYPRVCICLILALSSGGAKESRHKGGTHAARKLTRELSMGGGPGVIRGSDTCFVFVALMSAGDFFEGLEVSELPSGAEYRKGTQIVTEYPHSVKIIINTWVNKCGVRGAEDPALVKPLLEKLSFAAGWKTGMKIRPVKELSSAFHQPTLQEWNERPDNRRLQEMGFDPQDPAAAGIWVFELTVRDEKISLSDHLVVSISTDDGKQSVRFSGRL